MISKSDLIILVLASGALAIGIFRWHQNTQDVNAITIPASASSTASNSRVVVEPVENSAVPNATAQTATVPTATVATSATTEAVIDSNTPVNRSIQTDANGQIVVKTVAQPNAQPNAQPKPVVGVVVESDDAITWGSHIVQSGDYLGKIADQYGTDVQTLRDLNNIRGSIIQIGQEILYPANQ